MKLFHAVLTNKIENHHLVNQKSRLKFNLLEKTFSPQGLISSDSSPYEFVLSILRKDAKMVHGQDRDTTRLISRKVHLLSRFRFQADRSANVR